MAQKKAKKKSKKPKVWKPKLPFRKMRAASKRILLRPYRVSDFDGWFAGNAALRPKQSPFDLPPPPLKKRTKAVFTRRVKGQQEHAKKLNLFIFGVFDRKTGLWLGGIDFYIINAKARSANLGYFVLNNYWGQGYASEASRLALKIAFDQLDLKRVEASCELKNKASARVALNAGMFKEGLRRKYPIPSGMKDLFVFGMNSIDFKRKKRK